MQGLWFKYHHTGTSSCLLSSALKVTQIPAMDNNVKEMSFRYHDSS